MTAPAIRFTLPAIGLVLWAQTVLLRPVLAEADPAKVSSASEPSKAWHWESVADASTQPTKRSVAPTGWRRTTRGWELADAWAGTSAVMAGDRPGPNGAQARFAASGGMRPATVGQWVAWDRAREPQWANALLGLLKRINPLFYAAALVAVAVLIARISEPKTESPNSPVSGRN